MLSNVDTRKNVEQNQRMKIKQTYLCIGYTGFISSFKLSIITRGTAIRIQAVAFPVVISKSFEADKRGYLSSKIDEYRTGTRGGN